MEAGPHCVAARGLASNRRRNRGLVRAALPKCLTWRISFTSISGKESATKKSIEIDGLGHRSIALVAGVEMVSGIQCRDEAQGLVRIPKYRVEIHAGSESTAERKSVVSGHRGAGRVDLGGRRH